MDQNNRMEQKITIVLTIIIQWNEEEYNEVEQVYHKLKSSRRRT